MNERQCSLCEIVGAWFRRTLHNLCCHRGWDRLLEWNQRTCRHPRWNEQVWGDIHCASCGTTRGDARVDNFFAPVFEAMEKEGYTICRTCQPHHVFNPDRPCKNAIA